MRRDLILCLGAGCLGFAGAMMMGPAMGQPDMSNVALRKPVSLAIYPTGTMDGVVDGSSMTATVGLVLLRTWDDGTTDYGRVGFDPEQGCSQVSPCFSGWQTLKP